MRIGTSMHARAMSTATAVLYQSPSFLVGTALYTGLRRQARVGHGAVHEDLTVRARDRFFIRFLSLMVPVFIRRRLRKYFGSLTPKQRKDDKAHKMSVSGTLIAHTV